MDDGTLTLDWLAVGARIDHTVHGPGTVAEIAHDADLPMVWIDFDSGERKPVSLELGAQFLEPMAPEARGWRARIGLS